jgi:hypothetical protein
LSKERERESKGQRLREKRKKGNKEEKVKEPKGVEGAASGWRF